MFRIKVASLIFWMGLTTSLCGQSSFIAARHAADQSMVAVLRQLSQDLNGDTPASESQIRFVMCSQIDLGDIDGAVATMRRATHTGGSANPGWSVISRFERNVRNNRYLLEFLDRDELVQLPDRVSILNKCRLNLIRALLGQESPAFPEVLSILNVMGPPDSCVVIEGETETITNQTLLESWAFYLKIFAWSGDTHSIAETLNETKSILAREQFAHAISWAIKSENATPEWLESLINNVNDISIRNNARSRLVIALFTSNRIPDSVDSFMDLVTKNPDLAVDTGFDLTTKLYETGEKVLAIRVALKSIPLLEAVVENGEMTESWFKNCFRLATLQLIAGLIDESIESAGNVVTELKYFRRESDNAAMVYRRALNHCSDYLNRTTNYLVQEDQIEVIERLFEVTAGHESDISLALCFLRQVHEHKAIMYEDLAFRKFVNAMKANDDLEFRSQRAWELASILTIPLSMEQRLELFEIGKSGGYLLMIISEFVNRDVNDNRLGENLDFWINQLEIDASGKHAARDDYKYHAAIWLVKAGRFEEALALAGNLVELEYIAMFVQRYLQSLAESVEDEIVTHSRFGKIVEFISAHPDILVYISEILEFEHSELPIDLQHRLIALAMQRVDLVNREDSSELSSFAANLGLSLFELEKLFVTVRTNDNGEYASELINKAMNRLSIDESMEQVAGLKLAWFRDLCDNAVSEKVIRSGFEAGLRYVTSAPDTKTRLARFIILFGNWRFGNRIDIRSLLNQSSGGRM